jgi:hypothetical protein
MNEKLIHQIIGVRLAVGLLGEREQAGWWPSMFLGRHAHAFLSPIFGGKTRMAQYHGVTEAACRVHDESIGVGRVFHLFRLPESIEQLMFSAFQEGDVPEEVTRCFGSREAAESMLASLANGPTAVRPGPIRLGDAGIINTPGGMRLVAANYRAAFEAGIKCYPYFADR